MTDAGKTSSIFTPAGQMAFLWRFLHLSVGRYGNQPLGQFLVVLTMVFLHDRGMYPTLTDLCKATGLPKATVSRYISWQLREGLLEEAIDPNDRRRRVLLLTEKGEKAWEWQIEALTDMFKDVAALDAAQRAEGPNITAENLLAVMKWRTDKDRSL